MSVVESILLSLALAMDCFSIAFTCGIIEKRFHATQAILMAVLFGAFQSLMPLIGWGISGVFYSYIEEFAPIVAFALLVFIGGKMIWESIKSNEEHPFNPNRLSTLLYLSVATSIDALAIGITFTCMGMEKIEDIVAPLLIIGAGSFLLSIIGKTIGAFAGKRFDFNAELFGGIILVLLGVKTLILG